MEMINIEKRIDDIVEFFVKEEIAHPMLSVTFEENEPTCYNSDMSININFEQLLEEGDSGDVITCRGEEDLLDLFNTVEIAFFHELGHHCDLYHRLQFDANKMKEEIKESNEMFSPVMRVLKRHYGTKLQKRIEELAFEVYRSLPIEKTADENARWLMRYYLEHAK